MPIESVPKDKYILKCYFITKYGYKNELYSKNVDIYGLLGIIKIVNK